MSGRLEPLTNRVLRPSVPDDGPRLVAMFERCSPESRYARFLAPLQHFPASHLVDVVRSSPVRRSWVVQDVQTAQLVAVGSWFRNAPTTAELGLLVEDAQQRQGYGTAVLETLADSARAAGVRTLVGNTLADARHVHGMLRRLGPTEIARDGHVCTLWVALDDDEFIRSA